MDLQLEGRVVLVVGGRGTIGRAVVDAVRAEGAVAVSASRGDSADVRLDVTDDESVDAGVKAVLAEHGSLDAVVVTAAPAAGTLDPSLSSDPDAVAEAVATKSLGFLRVANAVLPILQDAGYGRIVGVSGQNAWLTQSIVGSVRNTVLNVSAKNLADACAGTGVTVNTVNPGPVTETPSAEVGTLAPGDSTPEQVATLITFLISGPAAAISGESIAVGHRLRGVGGF